MRQSDIDREAEVPKQIITSATAPTTGFTDHATPSPLAQGIRFANMLFVSGQGPLDPETREVVAGDIAVQLLCSSARGVSSGGFGCLPLARPVRVSRAATRRTLANLVSVLDAAGATLGNVVNMRVCLRDTTDFAAFNEAFHEFMAGEKVTRTCIGGTPHRAGVNVEIDCVAMFDD